MLDDKAASSVIACGTKGKRSLCVISTPFQLYSLLALRASGFFGEVRPTVLLHGVLVQDKSLSERLMQSGYFAAIYTAQRAYPVARHLGMSCLRDFLLCPRATKKKYEAAFPGVVGQEFDLIVASCADRATLEAKRFSVPHGRTVFIDDGEGTHIGFILQPLACFDQLAARATRVPGLKGQVKHAVRTVANRLVGKRSNLAIQCIYALNPDMDQMAQIYGDIPVGSLDPRAVPQADLSLICQASDVEAYRNARFIYLSFPGDMPSAVLERELQVVREMEEHTGNRIWIRLHPRRNAEDFGAYSELILGEAFWEALVFGGVIDSSKCLIGSGSTAQSSPFTLYGVKPQCIYLHRLFKDVIAETGPFERAAQNLRQAYGRDQKIDTPQSIADLLALLE